MTDRSEHRIHQTLTAEITTTLKERIISWYYPAGYRITEKEICQEFGVSRSPVRESLRELSSKGFIKKLPYTGYIIQQPDIKEIHDLYNVRLALESYVIEVLIEQGLPEEEYQYLYSQWNKPLNDLTFENLAAMDREFHEKLAQATGNEKLLQCLQEINDRLHILRMTDYTREGRVTPTIEQHLKILERIQAKDHEGARQAVRENIDEGRINVETAIKDAIARSYLARGGIDLNEASQS